MAGYNLPENVDATYPDSGSDPSVALHQQYHDKVHDIINKFDKDATPTDGQILAYSAAGGVYVPVSSPIPGQPLGIVRKSGGTWPARPVAGSGVAYAWVGADPGPAIVSSGTGGMLDNVDFRWKTP